MSSSRNDTNRCVATIEANTGWTPILQRADLELSPLQAGHRLDDRLDRVPLQLGEQVCPFAIQVAVCAIVQHKLEV